MRFADELRGSEGERCRVSDKVRHLVPRTGTIRSVYEDGRKVAVQFDDNTIMVVMFTDVILDGEES